MPRTRGTYRRGQIPDMLSIHVCPSEVGDRVMPCHLEIDFIKGAGNKSSVGVLVEHAKGLMRSRSTRAQRQSASAARRALPKSERPRPTGRVGHRYLPAGYSA